MSMRRLAAFLGFAVFLFGGYLLIVEMQKPASHPGHVYLFAGMMAFGTLLIVPSAVGEGLKQVIVVVGPYLPDIKIGGRRKTDPPADDPGGNNLPSGEAGG